MNMGYTNDRFFYESLKQRQYTNRISTVMDKNWNVVDDYSEVIDHYITFFRTNRLLFKKLLKII